MPSISATPVTASGHVLISIGWGDVPVVLYAKVTRVLADGAETVVRAHTATDSTGEYIELSGSLAVLYDTEAPMDVPIFYITEGLGSSSSATSATVTLSSDGRPWLKSPLHPWQDKRLRLRDQIGQPDCAEGDEVYFSAMGDELRQGRTNAFPVQQRKNPIVAPFTRGGRASVLRSASRTFAARDAVIELNASGDELFFQAPIAYGIPDTYMAVMDYTVTRVLSDHRKPQRINNMPFVEADRPEGLADGVLGVRWADVCDTYETFDDAEAAGLTTTMVLLGYASAPPSNPGFRLYSDIPIDFATYAAIPAVGTYADLLGGP